MKTPLTIEELKNRVGKPIFLAKYNEISNRVDLRWVIFKTLNGEILEFTDGVEDLKIGDNICFFNTEVSEEELKQYIEKELKEILDTEEKEKRKTGYERVEKGKLYYAISSLKEAVGFGDGDFLESNTEKRFKTASYFNDKNLAENIARAERLKYQLRRYAALNGGIPSQADWKNIEIEKYFIYYGCAENKIYAFEINLGRDFGQIYFRNKESCKKAIEIFKDELIWYFTKFEEQLY